MVCVAQAVLPVVTSKRARGDQSRELTGAEGRQRENPHAGFRALGGYRQTGGFALNCGEQAKSLIECRVRAIFRITPRKRPRDHECYWAHFAAEIHLIS